MSETDETSEFDFSKAKASLDLDFDKTSYTRIGRVKRVVGLTVEAVGIVAPIGAQCVIDPNSHGRSIQAEVVGFDGGLIVFNAIRKHRGCISRF